MILQTWIIDSRNVQDIQQSHEVYRGIKDKLENEISR